jgi:phage-related protein
MDKFKIVYFELDDGDMPARDFIHSLEIKMRAKVYQELDILEEYGNRLREPYSKDLGDGIFELRAKVGSNITRTLYFFYIDKTIVLTNGFIKKTGKTPPAEIKRAKKYRDIYLEWRRKK